MSKRSQCVPNTPREQACQDSAKPHTYMVEELRVSSIDQWWQVDAAPWEHKAVNRLHYQVTLEDMRPWSALVEMQGGLPRMRIHRGLKRLMQPVVAGV